ncbi:hypothetical protein QQZ08_000601 [Neonectria magnoliae]|uniref:CN hydrolase domain-containing protein n=1 Tax=Neonectria magnoliae TaxID=2732573 RepID=A0ABR1IHU5_9HYPO
MRIGCLQFAPVVGDVDNNLNRADAILNSADPQELDLLVLPEMAFSGYNFRSLQEIFPFLEPCGSGITSLWARTQALKHDCTVIVGYPEKVDLADRWPANPEYYNSAIVVSYEGDTVANYRKTHLYYTDETWALENPKGFFGKPLPGLGRVSIGICMDLNPYKFQTPWDTFEFANHVVNSRTRLVVVSMAWITQENPQLFGQEPQEADMNTLTYWISRLEPIIRAEWDEEVIVVFANRTGSEDEVTYAGTSAVVGIKSGEVWVYGILGRGDKELLVVDTDAPPFAKLVYRPDGDTLEVENESSSDLTHHRLSLPSGPNSPEQDFRRHLGSYTNDRPDSDVPESAPHREQTRKAVSYHRDDLSINVSQKRQTENRRENYSVHTPSAPSPTPQNIRPRLLAQPAEPAIHQYFNSDSFNPRGATFFNEDNQQPDANTNLTAPQMGLHRTVSPSNSSEGYLSEGVTSGNYGLAHGHHDSHDPHETEDSWILGHEDDHERHGRVENRHSLRSDVSVWNNQPGRPRTMATLPTPPQEPTLKKTVPTQQKTPQSRTSRGSRSRQPDSERSRHERRSNNPNRAKLTRPSASELKAGLSLLNEIAPRADSAQEPLLRFLEDRSDDPAAKMAARDGKSAKPSLSRMDTNITYSHHERALSGNSVPVAMDPSIWRNLAFPAPGLPSERQSSERQSSERQLSEQQSSKRQPAKRQPSERRSSDQVHNDQSILRPASRSRIGKRDASNQRRDAEQSLPPNLGGNHDRTGSVTQSNRESRAEPEAIPVRN